MKLKKVEIKGFKSFAHKTEIYIKDGITAIVGPNGSGKSNISDAVRWVLGEQSVKNLRGNKMEDVIFAGTSTRKPLGYCEVTITFDNKDGQIPIEYEEIDVTRRMFRSGESQYYINKNTCRLKDIRDIFMDTGIGKDGYSIIGQGRIDEILSNKPEDRRSIFEEAAGIVKYKSKKIEAEKKLDRTENNIIRIKDLSYELSKQLEYLELQADKANKFNDMYGQLKELEVNLIVKDIENYKNQDYDIDIEKRLLEDELAESIFKRDQIELEFNFLKRKINEIENQIDLSRKENMDSLNECDRNKNEFEITKEKQVFFSKDLDRLVDETKKINKKIDNYKISLEEINHKTQNTKQEYNEVLKIYNENKIKFDIENINLIEREDEIEKKKNNIFNIYRETADIKSKLNGIYSFKENIKKRIEQLSEEIINYEIQEKKIKSLIIEEQENKNINSIKLNMLLEESINLNEKFNMQESELLNIENKINKTNLEKQNKLSSLNILKGMERDYDGYYKGVKSILIEAKKNPELNKGLIGVVAELIQVDNTFEKAIEIALGGSSQSLVTETEEDAKNIISYLKKNKLGRVTCLPFDIIKSKDIRLTENDKQEFHILGLGYEVIDYNKRYLNIFKHLLGRTIIIENIEHAIKFNNKHNHIYKIVTLEGEVLNPGGSMTGGSTQGSSISIINRKNRLQELKENIDKIELELIELKEKKDGYVYNVKRCKDFILEIEEKIKCTEYELYNIENKIENFKNEQIKTINMTKKVQDEIIELEDEKVAYINQYNSLNNSLSILEEKTIAEKDSVNNLILIYNREKMEKEDNIKKNSDLKFKMKEFESINKNLNEKALNIENETIELTEELNKKEALIVFNINNIEKLQQNQDELYEVISELEIIKKDTKEKLQTLLELKDENMKEYYSLQDHSIQINKIISNIQKKINNLDLKLNRISLEIENLSNKLFNEYELTFERALENKKEILNEKESIVKSRRLKVEIKELGNVNLSSIEEYKSLDKRLKFILNQQKDLMEAKGNLNSIIVDMEQKIEKQFILNFNKINDNFKGIFKILFNGGNADLILENKEDILNSGIEINAQPPGKKLQSLNLLSGGEKSLTAVAILFSILALKPAPFCILDEIDAALDESNISKYTSYLKNFCHETQFILITHRKTTMEIADILYGVTVEEDGISKLISVELKDYIKQIAS